MPSTTYTVLVTVAHSGRVPPSGDTVERMIERGLEEGVRGHSGLEAACASVIVGDYLGVCKLGTPKVREDNIAIEKARKLHASLRD